MKKNRSAIALFFGLFALLFGVISCQKNTEDQWKKTIEITEKTNITDLSGAFFDPKISLEEFKSKYPWFLSGVSDEEYQKRRQDTAEIAIYQTAIKSIDTQKLDRDLSEMFSRVKHYFPKFKTPKVYLYSSGLADATEFPVIFRTDEAMLFVDISAFMGAKSKYYDGLDIYLKNTMSPEYIVPKIAEVVAQTFIIHQPEHNKFIDQIIAQGKIKVLQNAFLPNTPDHLKMGYTPQQQEWSEANEGNIWNYFVENDLVFSDNPQLYERFISVAPFSKFYTEIDQKSSPMVGTFIGWQIGKAFYEQHPEMKLEEFLTKNATDIFNQSHYKPEK